MKKSIVVIATSIVIALAFHLSQEVTGYLSAEQMNVQVKNGKLRQKPSFLSPLMSGSIRYGQKVHVLEQKGPWSKIRAGRSTGWIHTSALTDDDIQLQAGSSLASGAASKDEVALAGKGFNSEVENEYKSQNPELQFARIDRMEKDGVSISEIQSFIKEGQLQPEGM